MTSNKLEKEFTELMDSVGEQIMAHVKDARKSLWAATDLADRYGIPFFTNVSLLGMPYIPPSFRDKWGKLDKDFITNLTDLDSTDLDTAYGWSHSQIC